MRPRHIPILVALAVLGAIATASAETPDRGPFRPLDAPLASPDTVRPVVLTPATLRDVDRNGDGRVDFDELLAADFGGKG